MAFRERRDVLRGIGLMLPISTTGCLGLITRDSTEIEYRTWNPTTDRIETEVTEDLAGELLDAIGREEEAWVIVDILVKSGEVESNGFFRGTQVESNGHTGSMVGIHVHTPSPAKTITSTDENYQLREGARADLYYHITHTVERVEWVTGGLEGESSSITLVDRTA